MFISPIIDRELRTALRKHRAVRSRFYAAAAGAAIVLFFLLVGLAIGMRSIGREMHSLLFYVGLYMAVVPAATISVGLFLEERTNQTMELLYLAGVGPAELFGGKLLGGMMVASGNLLALAPVLAVPFLTGGISFDLFLATIACFPALLLFVTSVGLLSSVLCRDDGSALTCAVILGGIICLATPVPYLLGGVIAGTKPFSSQWLCLSPAYAPYLVAKNFGANNPHVFWLGWSATIAWTILFIGTAALLLRRTWRAELKRSTPADWSGRWGTLVYRSESQRAQFRTQRLEINAFQWLAERDRRPVITAWGLIVGEGVLWIAGWILWPHAWPSVVNFYLTAMVLIFQLETIMAFAAGRRIASDRRDGLLELLLTTPLMPEEIVDGQYTAVKRLFRPLRATVFGLCVLMMLAGLLRGGWDTGSLSSYALIWCLLLWWSLRSMERPTALSMWIAANSGRPAYTLFRMQTGVWFWIMIVYNSRNLFGVLRGARGVHFPTGSAAELLFIGLFAFTLLCVAAIAQFSPNKMRQRLIAELRSIAREPLPSAHDPRFKKWDVRERLPRSAYEEMAERVRAYADEEKERRAMRD